MKIYLSILVFILISCKTDNNNIVSESEMTNFISEILSDTTNLKIIDSKKTLISNFDFTPPLKPILFEGYEATETKYLSDILEEKDTLFIYNQFFSKTKINFNKLEKQGFKIFDMCRYSKNNLTFEEIKTEAKKMNKINNLNYGDYFIMIKKPIFNKKRNKVFLNVNKIGSGEEYLLIKENNVWSKTEVSFWVE